jgi:hypothetical protein
VNTEEVAPRMCDTPPIGTANVFHKSEETDKAVHFSFKGFVEEAGAESPSEEVARSTFQDANQATYGKGSLIGDTMSPSGYSHKEGSSAGKRIQNSAKNSKNKSRSILWSILIGGIVSLTIHLVRTKLSKTVYYSLQAATLLFALLMIYGTSISKAV